MRSIAVSLLALGLLAVGTGAQAQSVALTGMLGDKALLVVDGGQPLMLAPGQARQGVKLLSTAGQQAVVEVNGQRLNLRLGEAPASVGAARAAGEGNQIVLTADSSGHFFSAGQINGKAVQFLLDTGATSVSLSASEAERVGLAYKSGQMVRMSTANGESIGWRVKLSSVRLGSVSVTEVDAVVTPVAMPYVLLGNSFLTRFQMTRTNEQMVLTRRY